MGHSVVVGLWFVGEFDRFDHSSLSALIYLHQLLCLTNVTTLGLGMTSSPQDSLSGIGLMGRLMVLGISVRLLCCLGVLQIVLTSPHRPFQSSRTHALEAGWSVQSSSWFLAVLRLRCVGLTLSEVSKSHP